MISFVLSEEQKMLRDTVENFAQKEIQPQAREWEEDGKLNEATLKKGAELGLLDMALEEQKKRSLVNSVIALESLAYGDLAFTIALFSPFTVALPVALYGTKEQQAELLPLFQQGEFVAGSAGLTEPNYFFDLDAMQSRAATNAGTLVLNGQKAYVPFADQAPYLLIYALSEEGEGKEAIRAYLVKKGASGLKMKREKNMGLSALPTFEVTLTDTPATRLGNSSFSFFELLTCAYLAKAAAAVGVARASYEYSKEYAKTREAFGEPIASRQAIAFMIAENAIEIDAARALCWEAAWQEDQKRGSLKSAWQAQQYASEMTLEVCDRGLQILGGHGYIREHPVEMWLRNARGFACWTSLLLI